MSLLGRIWDMALTLNGLICKNKTDSSSLQFPFSIIVWHFPPQMLIFYKQIMLLQAQTKYTLCHLIWNIKVQIYTCFLCWLCELFVCELLTFTFWQPTISSQHLWRLYNLNKHRHFSYRLSRISSNAQAVTKVSKNVVKYQLYFKKICMPGHILLMRSGLQICQQASKDEKSHVTWPHRCFEHKWQAKVGCCSFPYLIRILFFPLNSGWKKTSK